MVSREVRCYWDFGGNLQMGTGVALEVRAFASRKVKTGFLSSSLIPLADIASSIVDTAKGTPLEMFAVATPTKFDDRDGFKLHLHPTADPFAIIAEKQAVLFGATTSHVGPGYHAFIVAALDAAHAKLGLKWISQGVMDDNTGYIRDRDFPRLQHTMAEYFRNECRKIFERRGGLGLSMPKDFSVRLNDGEVPTPFGPTPLEVIGRWSSLEGDELERAAAGFYPWWDRSFDAAFFRRLALSLMWMYLRWAKPLDHNEGRLITKALASLNEAVRLGAPPPVPVQVASELMALAAPNAPHFPHPTGIGYRRHNHVVALNGWEASVPCSLQSQGEEAAAILLRNDVFRVQMRTGVLDGSTDPNRKPLAMGEIEKGRGFFAAADGKGFQLEAVLRTPAADGPDRLCLMKIWMADETLRGMAEAIVDSVSLAPAGPG